MSGLDVKKLKQEIVISSATITLLLVLVFVLNLITGYWGISFVPGLRIARESLFIPTPFLAHDTLESDLGLLIAELVIAPVFFFQIRDRLLVTFSKNHQPLAKNKHLLISLSLLFVLNFLFSQS